MILFLLSAASLSTAICSVLALSSVRPSTTEAHRSVSSSPAENSEPRFLGSRRLVPLLFRFRFLFFSSFVCVFSSVLLFYSLIHWTYRVYFRKDLEWLGAELAAHTHLLLFFICRTEFLVQFSLAGLVDKVEGRRERFGEFSAQKC